VTALRVVVDLLYVTGRRGGTETYAREVLTRLGGVDPGLEVRAVTSRADRAAVESWFPGPVAVLPLDARRRASWALAEVLRVDGVARRAGADVLWCPANFGPLRGRTRRVVTVCDTIPLEHGGLGPVARTVYRALLAPTARTATHVLAISQDTADAAVRVLGVRRENLTVVPLAGTPPRPVEHPAAVAGLGARLGADPTRPVLLSAGNRMAHKNFDGLLRAVARIAPARRPFVVLPGGGPDDPLAPLVEQLGLRDDVLLPGWVPRERLEALYGCATLYVCPSLAEGFGLPVLDAMARGCPVLAHDIPVLREVGAGAARYVDARDPDALAAAVEELLADPGRRAAMVEAGLTRAAAFSWDITARETARVLRAVAEGS
jgi:glycosyltransferase involved in cell wall biosynthesis